MIQHLVDWLVGKPAIYDAIQFMVGASVVDERVSRYTRQLPTHGVVLDAGGGTERLRALFPPSWQYISIDNEPPKVRARSNRPRTDLGVLGDALSIPIRDHSIDVVVCALVSHHIRDDQLDRLIGEFWRVLRPNGQLIFLDAVSASCRPLSWLLWSLDRGAYPHTQAVLETAIDAWFENRTPEVFSVLHRYAVWSCVPRPTLARKG